MSLDQTVGVRRSSIPARGGRTDGGSGQWLAAVLLVLVATIPVAVGIFVLSTLR